MVMESHDTKAPNVFKFCRVWAKSKKQVRPLQLGVLTPRASPAVAAADPKRRGPGHASECLVLTERFLYALATNTRAPLGPSRTVTGRPTRRS